MPSTLILKKRLWIAKVRKLMGPIASGSRPVTGKMAPNVRQMSNDRRLHRTGHAVECARPRELADNTGCGRSPPRRLHRAGAWLHSRRFERNAARASFIGFVRCWSICATLCKKKLLAAPLKVKPPLAIKLPQYEQSRLSTLAPFRLHVRHHFMACAFLYVNQAVVGCWHSG